MSLFGNTRIPSPHPHPRTANPTNFGKGLNSADKRPAPPPSSPTLDPSTTSINPNHPAALGLSGAAKKKPPPISLGPSITNGTANGTSSTSLFGGPRTASPGAIGANTTTPSTLAGLGVSGGTAGVSGGFASAGKVFGTGFGASTGTGGQTSAFGASQPASGGWLGGSTSGLGGGGIGVGGGGFGGGIGGGIGGNIGGGGGGFGGGLGGGIGGSIGGGGGAIGGGIGGGMGGGIGGGNGGIGGGIGGNIGGGQQNPYGQSIFGQSNFGQSVLGQSQQQQQQAPIPQLQPGHQTLPPAFTASISSSTLPTKPSIFGDFGSTLRASTSTTQQSTQGPSNQNYGPAQPPSIENQLVLLRQKWDPTSPDCAFQTYFYNRVGTEQAALYTKPPNYDQKKWDEAVAARPDNSVVPVMAVGFHALKERSQLQENQVLLYRARMHEIVGKLSELQKAHDLTTAPKIETARDKVITLSHRTLRLAAKVQVLKSRGYALRPEEEVLKERLLQLERELRDPDSFGRVGEIWARLGAVKQRLVLLSQADGQTAVDWTDDGTTEMIAKILTDQSAGMNYLADVLKKELEEADALLEKIQERKKRGQFGDRTRRSR